MIPWKEKLSDAIQSGGPIILDLNFDPGWKDLCEKFEKRASLQKQPPYVKRVFDAAHRDPQDFKSTSHFIQMSQFIHETEPQALDRTYIHFDQDIRQWHDFVIGRNAQKMHSLQESFACAQPFISKIPSDMRKGFIEDEARNMRAGFPRFFAYTPSHETQLGRKGLMFDKGVLETTDSPDVDDFVLLQAVHSRNPRGREFLRTSDTSGVIATPYVEHEKLHEQKERALNGEDAHTKFGLVHYNVRACDQICTSVPDLMMG